MVAASTVVVAGPQHRRSYPNGSFRIYSIPVQGLSGADNRGGGSFAGGAALIQRQWIGYRPRLQHFFHRVGLLTMGEGVQGGVLAGFY